MNAVVSGGYPAEGRFHSVDVIRGLAIVLMALDHIRDYWAPTEFSALDLSHTSPAWFATRWITHFCAPAFIFLAGASAYFQLAKRGDKADVSQHLLLRGLWLVLLEMIVVNISWKAALPVDYLWLQVIWVIGLSMIICAGAIWLPTLPLAVLAILIVAGHDSFNHFQPAEGWLWHILHHRGSFEVFNSGYDFFIAYPLLPWPGVMLLGYLFGGLYVKYPQYIVRWSALLGIAFLCLFVLLRIWGHYGDPSPYVSQPTAILSVLSFLNVSKYPASLQFVTVTLGLCLLLLAFAQRFQFWGASVLSTFGRVSLFFYLLHIPLINLSSQLWLALGYGRAVNMLTASSSDWPEGYEPALWRAYLVWAMLLSVTYFLCRAYWQLKSTRRDVWLLRWI